MTTSPTLGTELRPRLLYARLLFLKGQREASENSHASEGMAVLSLQDALELFLRVVAEHFGANVGAKDSFESLLQSIDYEASKRSLPAVPSKLALRQINAARVSFKHHGIMPPRLDVRKWTRDAERILIDVSRDLLNLDFESVSLVSLIKNPAAANYLASAEATLRQGKDVQAVEFARKGLQLQLIETRFSPIQSSRNRPAPNGEGEPLARNLNIRMEAVETHLDMIAHGISLPLYRRFVNASPLVGLSHGGAWSVRWQRPTPSEETAAFCVEFAVDAVMKLEENKIGGMPPTARTGKTVAMRVVEGVPLRSLPELDAPEIRQLVAGDFVEVHFDSGEYSGYLKVVEGEGYAYLSASAAEALP